MQQTPSPITDSHSGTQPELDTVSVTLHVIDIIQYKPSLLKTPVSNLL